MRLDCHEACANPPAATRRPPFSKFVKGGKGGKELPPLTKFDKGGSERSERGICGAADERVPPRLPTEFAIRSTSCPRLNERRPFRALTLSPDRQVGAPRHGTSSAPRGAALCEPGAARPAVGQPPQAGEACVLPTILWCTSGVVVVVFLLGPVLLNVGA